MKSSAISDSALTSILESALQPLLFDVIDSGASSVLESATELVDVTEVEREGANWITLIADPECTKEQLAQLDEWLARGEENQRVFAELQVIWCQSDTGTELEAAGDLARGTAALDEAMASRSLVLKRLTRWVKDRACAEDLVQQAYQRLLLLHPSRLEQIESVRAYLYVVARNLATDYLRNKARDRSWLYHDGGIDAADAGTQDAAGPSVDSAYVMELMEQLPRQHQEVLRLSVSGYSYSEVARAMGVSIHTVRKYRASALRALRNAMTGTPDEEKR
jgi:RNA polymerase sigma-70 factor (ECF subfamily)